MESGLVSTCTALRGGADGYGPFEEWATCGVDIVDKASTVVEGGWDAGLLMTTAGDHTLRLLPPLVTGREDLGKGLDILEKLLC